MKYLLAITLLLLSCKKEEVQPKEETNLFQITTNGKGYYIYKGDTINSTTLNLIKGDTATAYTERINQGELNFKIDKNGTEILNSSTSTVNLMFYEIH